MLGGILKLTWSFIVLFLFVTVFWQVSITDALPTLANDDNVVKRNDDASNLFAVNTHSGAPVVKRLLHTTVDQHILIDRSYSPSHQRYFRKKSRFNSKKSSSNLFQSTGTQNKNPRAGKRIKAVIDDRLKRFRMLDQDEFQEMLKSLSQQTADEQSKTSNAMDNIGGMQLANYWSPI